MQAAPKVRLSEDQLRVLWEASIPREYRPDMQDRRFQQFWSEEKAEKQAIGRQGVQRDKQRKYVSECTPQQPGDERILDLYAGGLSLHGVAETMKLDYDTARRRLRACHPDGKSLK